MEEIKTYDLITIGSGVAAQTVVYDCASAGWNVALIEENELGGTCALRGCIPKKVLYGAGELIDRINGLEDKGISASEYHVDWSSLMSFKKSFTDETAENVESSMKKAGIEIYKGRASFIDSSTLQVNDEKLSSKYFFIATGSRPRPLHIPGEQYVKTSDQFLTLSSMPQSILFVGGGYISFEFAHMAALAGSKVTILHRGPKPLQQFESDVVDLLLDASEKIGISLHVNMPVHSVEKNKETYTVIAGDNDQEFSADLIIHGAGRIPNMDGLNLDKANVETNKKGILVNEYMQSISNDKVYAAGDISASGLPLTPVAGAEGKVVLRSLLDEHSQPSTISVIPSTLFTVPPLSSVGLTEKEVQKKQIPYKSNFQDTSSWFTTRRIGTEHAGFKVLIDKKTDRILGAHLLGIHSDEVINIFAMAMKYNITTDQLKDMIWSYPTSSYDINYMLS